MIGEDIEVIGGGGSWKVGDWYFLVNKLVD